MKNKTNKYKPSINYTLENSINTIWFLPCVLIDQPALKINGNLFMISTVVVGYDNTDNHNPINDFVVYNVDPDFNQSGNIRVSARTIKGLIKKIQKIKYKIVRGYPNQ